MSPLLKELKYKIEIITKLIIDVWIIILINIIYFLIQTTYVYNIL